MLNLLNILIQWVLFALALLFVAWVVPGITLAGFMPALLAVLVMSLINVFIRPLLMFLAIPINLLTLGLFTFIINAFLFLFVAHIVSGFAVAGFLSALLGSILLSIIGLFIHRL